MYFKKYSVDVISYYLLISLYFFYKQEWSSAQIQYNHSIFFLYFKHTHTHTHLIPMLLYIYMLKTSTETVLSLLSQFMSLLSPSYYHNAFALGLAIQCQVAMVRCSWLFRSYEESFKFLTIKCDVRCRYFEDFHQDLQDVTLHS